MNPRRLREIEDLYHAARERGAGVLSDVDQELRAEVEKLLAHDSESLGNILDQRAAELVRQLSPPEVSTGTTLGPYRIEAPLGHGGMGQVYRATDTRLARSVAIKISHERFSDRFELEARAIAALNHPHICTLYDVGPNYLVMELVEGEPLSERLKRGRLPLDETLRYGAQICDGLAAAHAKGIVHRDLKPANIMLTRAGVKLLDFGLAKSERDPHVSAPDAIMGTPAYMAPEQFAGKPADARSDLYALGLVMAEMATGKRVSSGGSGPVPSELDSVIRRCLAEDPDERWQSARDLKWALAEKPGAQAGPSRRARRLALAVVLAVALLLVTALAFWRFREPAPPQEETRMSVLLPEGSRPLSLAVSPDGRHIALVLVKEGRQQIWVRELAELEPKPLAGTDGAANPFWSPDNRSIGFFADARLKRIERAGGPVQTLCDALGVLGGTWNQNGDIVMGGLARLQRVSAAGGPVTDIPEKDPVTAMYPFFLPDGRHFLATHSAGSRTPGIWMTTIDGGESRQIVADSSSAGFVEPPPGGRNGTVLFVRAGTLMALPFDMKRLAPAGDAVPVAQGIAPGPASYWLASSSASGVLAYVTGQRGGHQYVWRDRQGRKLGAFNDAGGVAMISPDGTRLTGDRGNDIWVLEFASGLATRLTFSPPTNFNPVWSPDGRYVAYDKLNVGIYRKEADGARAEELLVRANGLAVPKSWSPDGRFLIYAQINPGTGADLMGIPIVPDPKPFALAQTPANEDQGQFSPDGRWVAYTSNESGLSEIYVIPFPPSPSGGKWMVSRGGGVQARWNRNGKELFYVSPDWKMMSVDVETGPVFKAGAPLALFQTDMVDTGIRTGPISWDLAPDGNRFLVISPNSADTSSLTVALNWRAGNR